MISLVSSDKVRVRLIMKCKPWSETCLFEMASRRFWTPKSGINSENNVASSISLKLLEEKNTCDKIIN